MTWDSHQILSAPVFRYAEFDGNFDVHEPITLHLIVGGESDNSFFSKI